MARLNASAITSSSDEQLFALLGDELGRQLPTRNDPRFLGELRKLPVGLRAMAATYELDVSLALDDLGWHFGNWHDEELARETLLGLKELEANEFAEIFAKAFEHAKSYWHLLGAENWTDWYFESELDKRLAPLNQRAWALWNSLPQGLFTYWVRYARKYPIKVGATE